MLTNNKERENMKTQRHGYGVYKWANGSLYKGTWDANKISDYGEYTWNDGRTY